jgi:hypothetical protein
MQHLKLTAAGSSPAGVRQTANSPGTGPGLLVIALGR